MTGRFKREAGKPRAPLSVPLRYIRLALKVSCAPKI